MGLRDGFRNFWGGTEIVVMSDDDGYGEMRDKMRDMPDPEPTEEQIRFNLAQANVDPEVARRYGRALGSAIARWVAIPPSVQPKYFNDDEAVAIQAYHDALDEECRSLGFERPVVRFTSQNK